MAEADTRGRGFGSGGWDIRPPIVWPPAVWPPLPPADGGQGFGPATRIGTTRGDNAMEDVVAGDRLITLRKDAPSIHSVIWTSHREQPRGNPTAAARLTAVATSG
jgi:hypothetical protein